MSKVETTRSLTEAQCQADALRLIADWAPDKSFDAAAVLADHPHWRKYRAIVMDLAYEEYCRRSERGERVSTRAFCDQFPSCRSLLRTQLDVHQLVMDHGDLLLNYVDWPQAGDDFLHFQLVTELGRGAFARVFLATEPELGGRRVALKICLEGGAEANTLGKLNHPNIVPVHSIHHDDEGLTAICMPYLGNATLCNVLDYVASRAARKEDAQDNTLSIGPARPLGDAIRSGRTDSYVAGILDIVAQLADALVYSHSRGIFHLDLKPSNVLLADDGRPMLMDFNLSFDQDQGKHRAGGTLPYMPPEQLEAFIGKTDHPVDARVDVFSLGVILHELVAGKLPFEADCEGEPLAEAEALLKRHWDSLELPADLSPGVAGLLRRCLATVPDERFQTMSELHDAIEQLDEFRRGRSWPSVTLRRRTMLAGLLAAAAGVFGYWMRMIDSEGQDADAVLSKKEGLRQVRALGEANEWHLARIQMVSLFEEYADGQTAAQLAFCYGQETRWRRASAYYHEALNRGFAHAGVFNNLGDTLRTQGRLEAAKRMFDTAIQVDPEFGPGYRNRAVAVQVLSRDRADRRQMLSTAITDIERAIEYSDPTAGLYLDAAGIYREALLFDADHKDRMTALLTAAFEICVASDAPHFAPFIVAGIIDREQLSAAVRKNESAVSPGSAAKHPVSEYVVNLLNLPAQAN